MIRTKGEAGTGNVIEAVKHMRSMTDGINKIKTSDQNELMSLAKEIRAPFDVVKEIHELGNCQ